MRQNMLRSTLLLTLSGIIAKTIDFLFRAYYSQKLGSEGMGIFSLTASLHSIMLTFATGGLGVAVSKIVSEQFIAHNLAGIKKTMRTAIRSVFCLSACVIFACFLFPDQITHFFLKEPRCKRSVLYLAPSIMFMGISYCIKGYFYASRRIFPPASSEFLEQAVKIISTRFLLSKWLPMGIEHGCEAVFLGISLGELSSCAYLSTFYFFEQKRLSGGSSTLNVGREIVSIALPSMITSLLSSFLRMKESVWLVAGLESSGLNRSSALSEYGTIYGMVMPLIVFPLTLLSSCFTLLVPEISRANGMKTKLRLQTLLSRIYRFTSVLGFLIMGIYFTFPEHLAELVYGKPQIAQAMRIISLLTPFMFMDSVSCGMLNGLGKQSFLLIYSISDSILRLTLIWFLVPMLGKDALIFVIALSNMLTFTLSTLRVRTSAKLLFEMPRNLIRPCISAFLTFFIVRFLPNPPLYVGIFASVLIFTALCRLFGALSKSDLSWLISRMFS